MQLDFFYAVELRTGQHQRLDCCRAAVRLIDHLLELFAHVDGDDAVLLFDGNQPHATRETARKTGILFRTLQQFQHRSIHIGIGEHRARHGHHAATGFAFEEHLHGARTVEIGICRDRFDVQISGEDQRYLEQVAVHQQLYLLDGIEFGQRTDDGADHRVLFLGVHAFHALVGKRYLSRLPDDIHVHLQPLRQCCKQAEPRRLQIVFL